MSEEKYLYSPRVIDPQSKPHSPASIEDGKNIILGGKEYIIVQKLGQGGFGNVYKCIDSDKKEYAVKKILTREMGSPGIPCLFEAAAMSRFNHPCLNRALMVEASLNGLYILEDLGVDLGKMIHGGLRNGSFININQLKNILYRVGKGISYLHGMGIVHGDIKSQNILIFGDNDVRLNDFNLTTYVKWSPTKLHLCTSLYRPLEVWLNKGWNEKMDIWAYGCMMYELIYNKTLIPYQGENPNKSVNKMKYVNAILDWANFNSHEKVNINKYNIDYSAPHIHSELIRRKANLINTSNDIDDREKELYINLMLRCLQVSDTSRPSIDTVLSDTLFANIRNNPEYRELNIKYDNINNQFNKDFYSIIEKEITTYVEKGNRELLRLATNICYKYVTIKKCSTHLIKRVSVWIAKKLLRTSFLSQDIPNLDKNITKENFLETELDICNVLEFKLI